MCPSNLLVGTSVSQCPHPEVPQWPCSHLPRSSRWRTKDTHHVTRMLNRDKSQMHSFPLSHGHGSVCLVSRQDPSACREALRGRASDPQAVLRAAWQPCLHSAGLAAHDWRQSHPRERVFLSGWEKGFRQRLLRESWEPFPTHRRSAGSRTMFYRRMSKIRRISPHAFILLIFHKDQLL